MHEFDEFDYFNNDTDFSCSEPCNPYLDTAHPEKGLALVQSLLTRNKTGTGAAARLTDLIDKKIMPHIDTLGEKEHEVFGVIRRIKLRLNEMNKSELLASRAVLGVGGRFSAGKSCFINSITTAGLPVDLNPTTSIATYIIHSEKSAKQAVTREDLRIELDDNAVEALTHEFFSTYGFGFAGIIDNLIIHLSDFRYPDIAILDTPGYSKPDEDKEADASDKNIALQQIGSADALVWLIDIQNGTITGSDFDFIESIGSDIKILFVFNKADLTTKENAEKILKLAKDMLRQRPHIDVFDVIAYNSFDGETVIGGDALERFMAYVSGLSREKRSVTDDIRYAKSLSVLDLETQTTQLEQQIEKCEAVLETATSPKRISSVVNELTENRNKVRRLKYVCKNLSDAFSELENRTNRLISEILKEDFESSATGTA